MAVISCKCKKNSMDFKYLKASDMPEGWDCTECPKDAPAPKAEEPAQPTEVIEESKPEMPKKSKKQKKSEAL